MTTRNALLEPISGDLACGMDCRYEDEFELIETEIGKLNNLYHREEPDWQRVAEQAQTLLTTRTKDLRLACWLLRAWWCLEGSAGLVRGCVLLSDLCRTFWPHCHPVKPRARLAALQSLLGVIDTQWDEHVLPLSNSELEPLETALEQLDDTLSSLLNEPLDELAPLVRRCRKQRQQRTEQTATVPASATAAPATPASTPPPVMPLNLDEPAPSAVASERDAAKLLRQLQEAARRLATFWQRENPADARRFRLSRVLTWSAIGALPGADNNGRTQLKPLPANKLHQYRDRLQQGDYAALLDELELSLTRAPFWLDGHYMSWQCLNGLQWQAAADEVAHQVRHFTGTFPTLLTLSFDDGTPFASDDARDWIGTRKAASTPQPAAPASTHSKLSQLALNDALEQLNQQGLGSALQPLRQGEQQADSERNAAGWRLAMARLCLHDKQFAAAAALLKPLYRQFDQRSLWQWDPDTGLELCRLLLASLTNLSRKDDDPAWRREVHERLCDLDVCSALEYQP